MSASGTHPHAVGAAGHATHHPHPTPPQRLELLLTADRQELILLCLYVLLTGLLSLAVPLAAQALVNTIAQGFFIQPLVVLTSLVLFGLLAAGGLKLVQLALVERLQQRLFARVALQLAERLPRIRHAVLADEYAPELVNRFFDVLTVQKTIAKLLLDTLSAAISAILGLVLIALYSPLLLEFALALLAMFLFIVIVLGRGGLTTSISESVEKYRVAAWLEELARCHTSLKVNGESHFWINRADQLVQRYLGARSSHFSVIRRQAIGNYLFQALANAATLGVGGWLVINRQLTLGQLVAAQLIVSTVVGSLDKVIKDLESFYDLLTGLDKVGHVTDLPVERFGGSPIETPPGGASVSLRRVRFAYRGRAELLTGLDLEVQPGERVSLVGISGAGKSTIAGLLCGLEEPTHGLVEVCGRDVRDIDLDSLRSFVSLVSDENGIFEGTIEENILCGRSGLTHEDLQFALDIARLDDDIATFPDGLQTYLVSGGHNLSHGQARRLMIARAVVERPRLLILDEAFTGIDESTKLAILNELYDSKHAWTLIDISHDAEVVLRSGQVRVLQEGRIVESGSPRALALRDGAFSQLFPDLAELIRRAQPLSAPVSPKLELTEADEATLRTAGVHSVADLLALGERRLAAIPSIGGPRAREIWRELENAGLATLASAGLRTLSSVPGAG